MTSVFASHIVCMKGVSHYKDAINVEKGRSDEGAMKIGVCRLLQNLPKHRMQ
jgi:hypothetical protein